MFRTNIGYGRSRPKDMFWYAYFIDFTFCKWCRRDVNFAMHTQRKIVWGSFVINFVTANIIFFSNFHISYWQYNFFDFPLLLLTVLNDCNGHTIWYKKTLLIILFLIQVSVNYTCRIHVGQVLQYKGLFHCYKATSSPFTMCSYSSKKL